MVSAFKCDRCMSYYEATDGKAHEFTVSNAPHTLDFVLRIEVGYSKEGVPGPLTAIDICRDCALELFMRGYKHAGILA